jgi:hypothetical protein
MNKKELKQMLKPLIKECIKEVIFEDGTLSTIISEVVQGVGDPIVENKHSYQAKPQPQYETDEQAKARLNKKRKQMMESIGGEAYNGVNLFEGTTPIQAEPARDSGYGPLKDSDPRDPGVDIAAIMNKSSAIWSKMKGNK